MKHIVTLLFFTFSLWVCSQEHASTTNQGVLYVAPGTLMTVVGDFNNTEMGEYQNDGEVLLRGHFNNDGITTFSPEHQGYTRFEGFENQDITGSVPAGVIVGSYCTAMLYMEEGDIARPFIWGKSEFTTRPNDPNTTKYNATRRPFVKNQGFNSLTIIEQ